MTIPNSNINWKRKGFGWIPDLPDITDPGLKTALNNQSRILTQEGVGYAEEIATSLLNVLENSI
ncbi:MAG: hypothetical protein ACOYM4_16580, partial [Nodosilinea sp.]